MHKLAKKIKNRQAKIAVCGLGYVGTVVAAILASKGFKVTGIDINKRKIKTINQEKIPFAGKEPGLIRLIKSAVSAGRLKATDDPKAYQNVDIILIAVETPIDKRTKKPTYKALNTATQTIGKNFSRDTLIIIESTIAPKTIDNVVLPKLERNSNFQVNKDFLLAHCPERVMPGRLIFNIQNYNRILGGYNQEAAKIARLLYQLITKGDVDLTDTLTAEVVKTAENAYRDVQIAFANELALICENFGVNVWEARKWINKCPFRDVHLPGVGVGGHCTPKDPWLLVANLKNKKDSKIIPLARKINDSMPKHMILLLEKGLKQAGIKIKQAKIAILGYSYLKNSGDILNSPTISLIRQLKDKVAEIKIHDPWVKKFNQDVFQVVRGSDAIILMTAHDVYQNLNLTKIKKLMRKAVIIDGRNMFNKDKMEDLGFHYLGIGNINSKK